MGLKSLVLRDCDIWDEDMMHSSRPGADDGMGSFISKLVSLDLSHNVLGKGRYVDWRYYEGTRSVGHLLGEVLSGRAPSLTTLNLARNRLIGFDLYHLVHPGLCDCKGVCESFDSCRDACFQTRSRLFSQRGPWNDHGKQHNSILVTLDLSGNNMGDEGVAQLWWMLVASSVVS